MRKKSLWVPGAFLIAVFCFSTGVPSTKLITPTASAPSAPQRFFGLTQNTGKIYLGWKLSDNRTDLTYEVYRSLASGSGYTYLKSVFNSSDCLDDTTTIGIVYYYKVRAVDANGVYSPFSAVVSVKAANAGTNRYISRNQNFPPPVNGIPIYDHCDIQVGDVDGDGFFEYLVPVADGIDDVNKKKWGDEGLPENSTIKVYLFDHKGTPLWATPLETNIPWGGEFPWTFHDLNGDGKDEIIGLKYVALNTNDPRSSKLRLVVMNANKVVLKESSDVQHDSGRFYLTIAYLEGKTEQPYIIFGNGYESPENNKQSIYVIAYDTNGLIVQNCYLIHDKGSTDKYLGSHMIRAADIDGIDGREEVVYGSTVLGGSNLGLLWKPKTGGPPWELIGHTDFIDIKDIRPDIPGLELLIGGNDPEKRLFLYNYNYSPSYLWKRENDASHAHYGWAANVQGDEKLECYTIYKDENRQHKYYYYDPYASNSESGVISCGYINDCKYSSPIDWDGNSVLELHDEVISNRLHPDLPWEWSTVYVADVIGDSREELLVFEGGYFFERINQIAPITGNFRIYTNTTLNPNGKKQTPWKNRLYQEAKRHTGYKAY